ncbi:Hypothetical predicted protein [Prunus dulcis]|uniref:Uncharacterized protein n=1 Tax=Prunus dulcis TaxID=3755 RepID=A0A5E4FQ72_PRUDU|nr:Hypothetical predicted protein [Prunus dulcis]
MKIVRQNKARVHCIENNKPNVSLWHMLKLKDIKLYHPQPRNAKLSSGIKDGIICRRGSRS